MSFSALLQLIASASPRFSLTFFWTPPISRPSLGVFTGWLPVTSGKRFQCLPSPPKPICPHLLLSSEGWVRARPESWIARSRILNAPGVTEGRCRTTIPEKPPAAARSPGASSLGGVAQWMSSGLRSRGMQVRVLSPPPSACLQALFDITNRMVCNAEEDLSSAYAPEAQMEERGPPKAEDAGSNPVGGTMVDEAHVVGRSVVIREGAGSNPVIHPRS